MDLFVWDHSFSTGLQSLDDQHRGLFEIFNELHRTLFDLDFPADRREMAVRRAFDRLMSYARAQFAAEEALMQQKGLDERHQFVHRRQHEQFIRNLRELWSDRSTLADPDSRMMGFLSSWIGLHVLGVDPSMVRQVQQVEAGGDPAQAFEAEGGLQDRALRATLNMVGRLYQELSRRNAVLGAVRSDLLDTERQMQMLCNRLEQHSRFDELLQVANRRYFDERLLEEVARAFRAEAPLSLLSVLPDNFVNYGVRLGSAASDACLQAIARAVGDALPRSSDLVARYSPHRLVVMMPETDQNGASKAAQRVVDAVRALSLPHPDSTVSDVVTVCVGVAGHVPRSREDGASLLFESEAAQQFARSQGGDRVGRI